MERPDRDMQDPAPSSRRTETVHPVLPAIEASFVSATELTFWNWDVPGAPVWCLYWNTRAGARIEWEEATTELTPGHLVLVGPRVPARLRLRNPVGHLFIHFVVKPPFHDPLSKVWKIPLAPHEIKEARAFYHRLINKETRLDGTFLPLAWISKALAAIPHEDWNKHPMDPRIHRAQRVIEEQMASPLTVAEVARSSALSEAAFARLFRKEVGESPHNYILKRRTARAAELLARTSYSLEAIAEATGFCDRFHLTHVFKRHHQMTPPEFRRRAAAGLPGA